MFSFSVSIGLRDQAATDNPEGEVARILSELARRVQVADSLADLDGAKLADSNGNTIGHVGVRR